MTERTYGIRMTADASGVVGATKATTAGLDALIKRAQELGINLRKIETDVAKVTSNQAAYNTILQKTLEAEIKYAQGLGQQAKQTKEAAAETEKFVKALKEKADTLGKNRAQTEAYRAAQLSLTDAQKASVATSIKQIEVHDENEKALARLKVVGLAAGAAIAAYGAHTAYAIKQTIDEADELQKLTRSLGVSTEWMSAFRYQMQLAGVSQQEFTTATRTLSRHLSEAQAGTGRGAELFRALGGELERAAKRGASLEEIWPLLADALARYAGGANKAALETELLGARGERMSRALEAGAAGFSSAAKEAAEFRRIVGPDFARDAEQFNENLRRMNALLGVQAQILARDLVPQLNVFMEQVLRLSKQEGGMASGLLAWAQVSGTEAANPAAALQEWETKLARLRKDRSAFAGMGTLQRWFSADDTAILDAQIARAEKQIATLKVLKGVAEDNSPEARWKRAYDEQTRRLMQIEAPADTRGSKRESDYDRIIGKIREHTAVAQLDLDTEARLTQGQREAMSVMVLLRDGKLKLTDTQKVAIAQAFEEQIALERLVVSQSEAAKSAEHWTRAESQALEGRQRALAGLEEKNTRQREEIEQIGLTAEELGRLKIRRAEEAVAIAQQNAELANVPEAGRGELEYLRERIRLAEENLRLTREGVVRSAETGRLKKEAEEFKRNAETIERSLTDALMRGFEAGKDPARAFWDTMKNMARTVVLRPLIQPMVEPLGQFGAGLAKSLGGGIGEWMRSWGGGGSTLGNAFDVWAGVTHAGGVVGVDRVPMRSIPALAFAGAPRMHDGGIVGDEVPTILKKNEGVFTPAQMRKLAPVEAVAPVVNYAPTVNIDARGADAGVEQRLRESFGAMLYQHRRQIAGLVDEAGRARGRRVIA